MEKKICQYKLYTCIVLMTDYGALYHIYCLHTTQVCLNIYEESQRCLLFVLNVCGSDINEIPYVVVFCELV